MLTSGLDIGQLFLTYALFVIKGLRGNVALLKFMQMINRSFYITDAIIWGPKKIIVAGATITKLAFKTSMLAFIAAIIIYSALKVKNIIQKKEWSSEKFSQELKDKMEPFQKMQASELWQYILEWFQWFGEKLKLMISSVINGVSKMKIKLPVETLQEFVKNINISSKVGNLKRYSKRFFKNIFAQPQRVDTPYSQRVDTPYPHVSSERTKLFETIFPRVSNREPRKNQTREPRKNQTREPRKNQTREPRKNQTKKSGERSKLFETIFPRVSNREPRKNQTKNQVKNQTKKSSKKPNKKIK
jgi:hypothetical protein